MHRSLVGGHVQHVVVGRMGAGEVALMQIRIPRETAHIVGEGTLQAR
jgi:hypothetical protein